MGPPTKKSTSKGSNLTIADLPEVERDKVSRLVERLVTLGTEHQDTVDKLAALEAKCIDDAESAQKAIDDVRFSSAKDVQRLNDVVSALEDQRSSAFNMLGKYQIRLEQMAELVRKKEADEISGERRIALFANLAQLEAVVENQKSMIDSFQNDRENLEKTHQEALYLASQALSRQENETKKKSELILKSDKRCSAIEMACSRLTKQITEMTRRDTVKQAEIDALKRLLTERVVPLPPAPVVTSHTSTECTQLLSGPQIHTTVDTRPISESKSSENIMPPTLPADSIAKNTRNTTSLSVHQKQTTPPHSPAPHSNKRAITSSPKRKLALALVESREETNGQLVSESVLNAVSPARSAVSNSSTKASEGSGGKNRRRHYQPVVVQHNLSRTTSAPTRPPASSNNKALNASLLKSTMSSRASQAISHTPLGNDIYSTTTSNTGNNVRRRSNGNNITSVGSDVESIGSGRKVRRATKSKNISQATIKSTNTRERTTHSSTVTAAAHTAGTYARTYGQKPLQSRPNLEVMLGENKQYDPILLDLLSSIED
jgi:hypothetical protein